MHGGSVALQHHSRQAATELSALLSRVMFAAQFELFKDDLKGRQSALANAICDVMMALIASGESSCK